MLDQKSWCYPTELSKQEERICARLKRNGKLFVFLRQNRHLIFSEEVHQKLLSMYSDYPRGKPIVCPMLLAMVSLLQAYEQESDASAVLESMFDQRWQMVLGCLGTEHPIFSQGVLCDFRHRLIKYNMDVMLLERTVEVAKEVGGFCYKQLRIALDSAPLEGAGRVEDTFNLIGHALELLVDCAAQIKQTNESEIIKEAGIRFIGKYSIKAALDIDWSDIQEKNKAINILLQDVAAIRHWLSKQPVSLTENQYLKETLSLLETVLSQNIEPDPDGGSKIIDGVAPDRRISITDSDMRHGRKSSSRTINGFKQHIAIDLDHKLILATTVRPANEPEHEASKWLKPKVEKYGTVVSKSIDRGYLAADWTSELFAQGKKVIAKPWNPATQGKYGKKDFVIDLQKSIVTCPAGQTQRITGNPGSFRAKYSSKVCSICPIKNKCSDSKTGRTIAIHDQEAMLQTLKYYVETPEGRKEARERVKVEHALASICNRKGTRARYAGLRLNEYDLNRTAMVTNLHIALNLAA
jgi:hypothetical protein